MKLRDRSAAGALLGRKLREAHWPTPVLLALSRGGIPVGAGVAAALGLPLDVLVARKLAPPGRPHQAYGGIAEGGGLYLDPRILSRSELSPEEIEGIRLHQEAEIARQVKRYRGDGPLPDLRRRVVVLIDDGLSTGGTLRAALGLVRASAPAGVVVAVAVGPSDEIRALRQEADEVVALLAPRTFGSLADHFSDFRPIGHDEVCSALARTRIRPCFPVPLPHYPQHRSVA
jgi:putative phosphoribosyl transferase